MELGALGIWGDWETQELGGPSETRRLTEMCLLEVEPRRPPRQKIQDLTNDQNSPRYAQNHPHRTNGQRTKRLKERSQEDCGIQELGGIGETGRSKVPNVRRVRESEIREIMLFIST